MKYMRALLSSGLNTASGRLGAIEDADQALAEGFAKFCLSPEKVYNPNAPLMLNGTPLVFDDYNLNHFIQNARQIWGVVLQGTVHSVVKVFGLFVRAYYSGHTPMSGMFARSAFVEHTPSEFNDFNSYLRHSRLKDNSGQPLEFKPAQTFEETMYATDLYKAVSDLFRGPTREEEHAANSVVADALHDLLDLGQLSALRKSAPPGIHPEYRFLREKYARPRNTPASIAKAQRVNAALDMLEARDKPRPGLYSVFIQPQE